MIETLGEAIEVERRIQAPPELVFTYFTDPKRYRRWQGVAARLDPRPGGIYEVDYTASAGVRGRYVVVDPPNRLVFTWGWVGVGLPPGIGEVAPGSSSVEVLFIRDGDATIVRLRHSELPTHMAREMHGFAWVTVYLERLSVAVAGGDPGLDPVAVGWPE